MAAKGSPPHGLYHGVGQHGRELRGAERAQLELAERRDDESLVGAAGKGREEVHVRAGDEARQQVGIAGRELADGDALLDDATDGGGEDDGERLLGGKAFDAERATADGPPDGDLPEEHQDIPVAADGVEEALAEAREGERGRCALGLGSEQNGVDLVTAVFEDSFEDGFLIGEVAVEGAEAEIGGLGDVGDGGGLEAVAGEEAASGDDERVAVAHALALKARS